MIHAASVNGHGKQGNLKLTRKGRVFVYRKRECHVSVILRRTDFGVRMKKRPIWR